MFWLRDDFEKYVEGCSQFATDWFELLAQLAPPLL